MRFKTTFRLFVLLCALCVAFLLVEYRPGTERTLPEQTERVVPTDVADINAMSLHSPTGVVELIRRGQDWFLLSPVRARADRAEVVRVLDLFHSLKCSDPVTTPQRQARRLSLADYGFKHPRGRVILSSHTGDFSFSIGDDAVLESGSVYVHADESDTVMATSKHVLDIVSTGIDRFRDRSVLKGTPALVTRLEIRRNGVGFVQLVRQKGKWELQQPVASRADDATVNDVLDALFALRVLDFYWDAGASLPVPPVPSPSADDSVKAQVEVCGLAPDSCEASVFVWIEGDALGQELILGRRVDDEAKTIYAKRRETDAIYTVDARLLDAFELSANQFRNRTIFESTASNVKEVRFAVGEKRLSLQRDDTDVWMINEPVQWRADPQVVSDSLSRIHALHVKDYVDPSATNAIWAETAKTPQYSISLQGILEDGDEEPSVISETLDVLMMDDDLATAAIKERNELVHIDAKDLDWLTDELVDPLAYRDRVMLAIKPGDVRSLSLVLNDIQQSIMRDENGRWIPATRGGKMVVDFDVVDRTLMMVSNLKALRIETREHEQADSFGLEDPIMSLKFGLKGDAGIEKSLMTGFRSRTDGIYAMVHGQDLVFVLEAETVSLLARAILVEKEDATSETASDDRDE